MCFQIDKYNHGPLTPGVVNMNEEPLHPHAMYFYKLENINRMDI
jgi:hypothetical protein